MYSSVRQSDAFVLKLLNGLRFAPSSVDDHYTSGIHSNGGLGGVGYSYWTTPSLIKVHSHLQIFRSVANEDLSFEEANDTIDRFIRKSINPLIAGNFGWQTSTNSLLSCLSSAQIQELQQSFYDELVGYVAETFFWFPVNSVSGLEYVGERLVISRLPVAQRVSDKELGEFLDKPILASARSYIGVRARSIERAKEKAGVVIGSLFLCMCNQTQFRQTMGRSAEGILSFQRGLTLNSSRKHIPYLAYAIELSERDRVWIQKIESFLHGGQADKKISRALRWLQSAWFAEGAERFTLICQAVDALTPNSAHSMGEKCGWIMNNLTPKLEFDLIAQIFKKLRSDVMHGDAPSLTESDAYVSFLSKYGVDPVEAATEIACRLAIRCFVPELVRQPNPWYRHPESLAQQKAIFARYGINYEPKLEFDFAPLQLMNPPST